MQDNDISHLNSRIDDSNIEYKKKAANRVQYLADGSPLFSIFEISESGVCNRKCAFCPRSSKDFPEENKFIESSLISSMATELGVLEYRGTIMFSGFVEPMLDKKISDHVTVFRRSCPEATIDIVTNGDPLNIRNLELLNAAGISHLIVSMYDGPEQIDRFLDLGDKAGFPKEKMILRPRWRDVDGFVPISLSNRGGLMAEAEAPIANLENPLRNVCNYPAYTFFVDYLGDVLLCPHDWGKIGNVGNVRRDTIENIWCGTKLSAYRKSLLLGKRGFSPCDVCNVKGDRMGEVHGEAFSRLDETLSADE